jgi:hypothetical protein
MYIKSSSRWQRRERYSTMQKHLLELASQYAITVRDVNTISIKCVLIELGNL